tara:strand:+ start:11172 stop:11621 length:450 start_codon:yes stop_codon:yes gene_type:complete
MSNKTVKILGSDMSSDHHLVKPGRSMYDALDLMKCLISENYKVWSKIPEEKTAWECQESESDVIAENMYHKFATTLDSKEGNKYIKITTGGSVWGFIVNIKNDKKFKYGDLLKAAGWKAPARNFARGNVIDDTVESLRNNSVSWTGVKY